MKKTILAFVVILFSCSDVPMPTLSINPVFPPQRALWIWEGLGTDSLTLGMTRSSLESRLGNPVDTENIFGYHYISGDISCKIKYDNDIATQIEFQCPRMQAVCNVCKSPMGISYGQSANRMRELYGEGRSVGTQLMYYDSLGLGFKLDSDNNVEAIFIYKPINILFSLQTYTDSTFSIKYPDGWRIVKDNSGNSVSFFHPTNIVSIFVKIFPMEPHSGYSTSEMTDYIGRESWVDDSLNGSVSQLTIKKDSLGIFYAARLDYRYQTTAKGSDFYSFTPFNKTVLCSFVALDSLVLYGKLADTIKRTFVLKSDISAYAITYDGNGNTGGSVPSAQTKTQGVPITISGNTGNLVKTGYTFAGWNTASDGSGSDYVVGSSYTADANVNLYAKWTSMDSGLWTVTGNNLTDPDGNTYTTVTIGNQEWTVENIRTTKYNDGTLIPYVSDSSAWASISTPGYCWYANSISNKATYGALYNWYVVNTGKLAPAGWHVPTDADWAALIAYLGGGNLAGGKLKEAGTLHWQSPNTGATNVSGFSALPGGYRLYNGNFKDQITGGCWWSATENDASNAYDLGLKYNYGDLGRNSVYKKDGFSVRLVRNLNLNNYTITYDGNGNTGGSAPFSQVKAQGVALTLSGNTGNLIKTGYSFDGWNTSSNGNGTDFTGGATYTADASVKLYAKWTVQSSSTVTDIDGNVYTTVVIGTQTWMKENLRTTKYNNGVAIPCITDATTWWQTSVSTTTGAYCNYANNVSNATVYGRIYNWNAVNTGKLCPAGWHIPTEDDWNTLQNYLITHGYNYDGTTSGNKIGKSLAYTLGWNSSSQTGDVGNEQTTNNTSGFAALPGGYRNDNGLFSALHTNSFFWTSTGSSTSKWAYYKNISYLSQELSTTNQACGYCGFYVRCIKD